MSSKSIKLSDQARRRLEAGDLILRGFDNDEIIDILEISLSSVKRWRKKIESRGLHALARKSRTDYSKKLDDIKLHELKNIIRKGARASGYLTDRWTSRVVADLIRKKWGVDYSCSHVRRILHSLNLSCQKPDVEAAEHSPEAVEYWPAACLAANQKKADDNGYILIFWDESGFSFVPNCVRTWAPVGHTPILFETSGRHNHSGIGYITRTPCRHLLRFRFTMIKGAANTEDFIFFLMQVHHYYGKKAMIVWDNLSAHYGAENYFEDEHPDWFDFEYLPSHSPELNPVEPCWNHGKHVYLPNFVPTSEEELVEAVYKAMERINEDHLLPSFFEHAGLDL